MHKIGLTAAGLGLVGIAALCVPAHAASPSYVALGDSYSSGTGTRSYLADGSSCQRSTLAYPSLISAARGYALNFRACAGATIPDVTTSQLSALSSTTGYVSLSVGGNDAGFADVLTTCAQPAWMSNCNRAIDTAQSFIRNTLPGRLSTLYSSIRGKAPNARVAIVGYPRIFNGEDCNALTWFSPEEEARLNQTADLLNATMRSAAQAKGFGYADPTSRFIGHAVCDDQEWINGLSNPITESYHPKAVGHSSGYSPTVSPVLTGTTTALTTKTTQAATAAGPQQARLQREYAALDAGIEPRVVKPVDLTSARAKAAAAKAGVDLRDRASIDRADRAYSRAQAR